MDYTELLKIEKLINTVNLEKTIQIQLNNENITLPLVYAIIPYYKEKNKINIEYENGTQEIDIPVHEIKKISIHLKPQKEVELI